MLVLAVLGQVGPSAAQDGVTLAWEPADDRVTAGYIVVVGMAPGAYVVAIDVGGATSVSLPFPPGGIYYTAVRGYSSDGLIGPLSPDVVVNLAQPPGSLLRVEAATGQSTAMLSWAPPATGGIPSTYLISVGSMPGASDILNAFPVGNVRSAGGAVLPGRYYARVAAANAFGVGPASSEVSFQVGQPAPPTSPRALTARGEGDRLVQLSWTPGDGPAATTFVLEAGLSPGTSDVGAFELGHVTSLTFEVPPGTYYVRVHARNQFGASASSNEVRLGPTP